jgi:Fe-S-cluster-containing hydrogenase component 2
MCIDVVHKYICGHTKKDQAPCAAKKSGGCKGQQGQKTISHSERCASCGSCMFICKGCLTNPKKLTKEYRIRVIFISLDT